MTQMSKDIIGIDSIKKTQQNAINDREKHIQENNELRVKQKEAKNSIKYFKPLNGVIVDTLIIDKYYKMSEKGDWMQKSDQMLSEEVANKMLDYHEVLSVSDEINKKWGIEVGDYIIKKSESDYSLIRINDMDYIIFEPYAIGGFVKKENYDKLNKNGSVRSDQT